MPAGKPFVIHFTNKEAVSHNVAVYDSAGKELFKGDFITSSIIDYSVPALPAGQYVFQCDAHPTQMTGALTAK